MHRNITGKLLPVTMVGSYPRPRWYKRELHGMDFREAWLSVDWWEEWTDALKGCLADQQAAGLDIVTDGELYDYEVGGAQWPQYFLERVGGAFGNTRREFYPALAFFGPDATDILKDLANRWPTPPITEKIRRGPWRFAEINRIARTFAERPVKCSFIDPQFVASYLENQYYPPAPAAPVPPDLVLDLCKAVNEELRDLEASGCPIYQCDFTLFPVLGMQQAPKDAWDFTLNAYNDAMLDGVGERMQIWIHSCWGNPAGQLALGVPGSYRPMMDRIFDAKFDVLNLEVFHDQGAEIDLLAAVPKDRGVALGLTNHRTTVVENPAELAALVRKALKYVEPDRLYLTTACGLMHLPRQNAFFKLKALADAARLVRTELTGVREDAPEPAMSA